MSVSPQDVPPDVPQPRSYLRNLIPILLFTLLCGIVGPIFLVMGLTVPSDEPGTGWLLPTGIGITLLDVVIALALASGRTDKQHKMYRLRTRGRRARGRVLSFEQTGVRVNDQPMIVIRMMIEGGDITPFEAQVRSVVPDVHIPLLHAGELPILIDPETDEWEIDWDSAQPVSPAALRTPADERPAADRPAADRLAELDDLLRRDLVSRDEYDAARARILDEL
ncbi:MAG TPA: SHOCT domain-containing protein [Nocardioides sp.]|nr:SHOCT domain-containing protein [Nocardioides sp.]